jgi:hypothetical protein
VRPNTVLCIICSVCILEQPRVYYSSAGSLCLILILMHKFFRENSIRNDMTRIFQTIIILYEIIWKYFSAERFSTCYCMFKCKYTVYCIYTVYWIFSLIFMLRYVHHFSFTSDLCFHGSNYYCY